MAGGILPDEGIGAQLDYLLRAPIPGVLPWQLWLWVNDIDPTYDTVLSELEEANFIGYSRRTLDRETWTVPTVSVGCCSSTYGVDVQNYDVVNGIGETVYGLAYVDQSNGVIRYVQRFDDDDIRPLQSGEQFRFLPVYTLTSSECASELTRRRRQARARKKT